ncbi:hypothetical protein WN51_10250 [Melipona quadrifasciata]|uniref:Uncharacterized protein n=1 Tax=Melipona quadrifasciata TaxID=166423 RepID=A0A0M9A4N1_9HYME|nr:hypothetical protein WN51_10250 [Melipona quadrifasciata]
MFFHVFLVNGLIFEIVEDLYHKTVNYLLQRVSNLVPTVKIRCSVFSHRQHSCTPSKLKQNQSAASTEDKLLTHLWRSIVGEDELRRWYYLEQNIDVENTATAWIKFKSHGGELLKTLHTGGSGKRKRAGKLGRTLIEIQFELGRINRSFQIKRLRGIPDQGARISQIGGNHGIVAASTQLLPRNMISTGGYQLVGNGRTSRGVAAYCVNWVVTEPRHQPPVPDLLAFGSRDSTNCCTGLQLQLVPNVTSNVRERKKVGLSFHFLEPHVKFYAPEALVGNDAKNASHRDLGDINVINIVLPPAPNVIQLPDVASSVDAAEQLLATTLGSVGNLVDALQNVVTAALRGVQPVADLLNILTQVVDAFSKVAAEEPLNVAVLVIKNGVQLVDAILEAVIPVVELNIGPDDADREVAGKFCTSSGGFGRDVGSDQLGHCLTDCLKVTQFQDPSIPDVTSEHNHKCTNKILCKTKALKTLKCVKQTASSAEKNYYIYRSEVGGRLSDERSNGSNDANEAKKSEREKVEGNERKEDDLGAGAYPHILAKAFFDPARIKTAAAARYQITYARILIFNFTLTSEAPSYFNMEGTTGGKTQLRERWRMSTPSSFVSIEIDRFDSTASNVKTVVQDGRSLRTPSHVVSLPIRGDPNYDDCERLCVNNINLTVQVPEYVTCDAQLYIN